MNFDDLINDNVSIAVNFWNNSTVDDSFKAELESFFKRRMKNGPHYSREAIFN